jgi:hypothetical protein
MFIESIIGCVIAAAGYYFYKEHKKDFKQETPVAVLIPLAGRYAGLLTPPTAPDGSMLAWGAPNDEHPPAMTAQVLAERTDWKGAGYCQGGTWDFTVHADNKITGAASVFGHHEPIMGTPSVDTNGSVTMALQSHWISLSFKDGKVTGKLWEGHDELKRSIVTGSKV